MKRIYVTLIALLLLVLPLIVQVTPRAVGQNNDSVTYLPIVFGKDHDLDITQIILTQATQTDHNGVPLVAGRRTIARVFVQLGNTSAPPQVIVSLSATRDGIDIGTITAPPRPLPANPNRDQLASTFNFELPANWLSGTVQITATATGANRSATRANQLEATASFFEVPDLDVKIIPLNYNHTGPTNPGNYYAGNVDHISNYLFRTYPVANVNISYRAPYNYTSNLETGEGWISLLEEMSFVKEFENAPRSQVYYASVPTTDVSGQTWFFGGIAGYGYIGYRASVGLDLGNNDRSGSLAAHEVGHNFARRHAPCGNPAGVDVNYPYPDARIGVHGFDITTNELMLPQSDVRDVMSYCRPEWVSDYTYRALFDDQRSNGLRAGEIGDVLLVRVRLDGEEAEFLPLYRFEGRISADTSDTTHQLQYLNTQGTVVATQNVQLLEAIEKGVSHRAIVMSVPQIDADYESVRLLIHGEVTATHTSSKSVRETATVERVGQVIRVMWADADRPHSVRVANEDGTYTLMGLDLTGGVFEFSAGDMRDLGRVEVISAE